MMTKLLSFCLLAVAGLAVVQAVPLGQAPSTRVEHVIRDGSGGGADTDPTFNGYDHGATFGEAPGRRAEDATNFGVAPGWRRAEHVIRDNYEGLYGAMAKRLAQEPSNDS